MAPNSSPACSYTPLHNLATFFQEVESTSPLLESGFGHVIFFGQWGISKHDVRGSPKAPSHWEACLLLLPGTLRSPCGEAWASHLENVRLCSWAPLHPPVCQPAKCEWELQPIHLLATGGTSWPRWKNCTAEPQNWGEWASLHCPSLKVSEDARPSQGISVHPVMDGHPICPGWFLPGALSCWERLQLLATLNWNK